MVGKEEFAASVEIPLITGALVLHWSHPIQGLDVDYYP